jgi:hypothetical protein
MYGHPVLRIVVVANTGNAVITVRFISPYRRAAAPQAENKGPLCIHSLFTSSNVIQASSLESIEEYP